MHKNFNGNLEEKKSLGPLMSKSVDNINMSVKETVYEGGDCTYQTQVLTKCGLL
jgi:hypothetical protein